MVEPEKPTPSVAKLTQGRSPAYPYIPLGKAMDRLQRVVDAGVGRNAYPPETFYQLWGIGAASSGSRQTMAALNHFGLVDYVGRGDDRKVKLSDLALKIALDRVPESTERALALQVAALTPPIHADLYQRYGHMLPADVVLLTYLTRDRGYNATAAKSLIDEYRDTLAFASLDKPQSEADSTEVLPDEEPPPPPARAQVGDLVQVEINGVFQLNEPKRLRAIQPLNGREWGFVEGSNTGIPMESIIVKEAASNTPPIMEDISEDAVIGRNEREWMRGPLSKEVSYRIVVSGDLGPREIGKLIKLLEAQKLVLSDDDDDA